MFAVIIIIRSYQASLEVVYFLELKFFYQPFHAFLNFRAHITHGALAVANRKAQQPHKSFDRHRWLRQRSRLP